MLVNDIRFAVRALARSRTFTITALATLALGISVNTAIFSVIDSVLLTPPPFDAPERIVAIEGENKAQGARGFERRVSGRARLAGRAPTRSRRSRSIATRRSTSRADDRAERASGARVSANFFRVFGVQAAARVARSCRRRRR